MFDLSIDDIRNMTSASKRAEDRFACQRTAQPTGRHCLLFADTVYAVSVFALFCLLVSAVVVYYLHVQVTVIVYAVLILSLLAAWLAYYNNNIMSA
ncbi:hypothetical protein SDC9_74091 [bioreactor metagenome]|uniref:Uncharacterized protein n=1 Tax=bioreactor metagenome TaxID=1076179 RepID=A0A644YHV7_9ZZZZ